VRTASRPPAPATALIGRDTDIEAVLDLLGRARLVTLTGPPGVGKTRLATAAAATLAADFADGVVWVDLSPLTDAQQAGAEIARTLDESFDPDALLVLDNFEHVLDAAPALARLLGSTTRLRILATSRERLRLSAEHEYAVPPLAMPSDPEVDDLARLGDNPAVAVLLSRAPANIKLTVDTARALADICIRLDGLPLALELAAARLRVFSPSELAFRLDHRTAALSGGPRDAPARHRDLRAAIAWSHDLLSDRDRAVFRTLSVFPNDWSVAAAAAVCDEPEILDAIESLLDKSLIRRLAQDQGEARFTMLMSLREFAAEQLGPGEAARARARHTKLFADAASAWERTVGTADEIATWILFATIRADLRTAFEHSRTQSDADATLWLASVVGWYWYTRGSLGDAQILLDEIARATEQDTSSPDARASAVLIAGVLTYAKREPAAAEAALRRAADLAEQLGDDRRRAIATAFLGHLARDAGDFAAAHGRYETVREIYAQQGNTRGLAWASHDLGLLAIELGDGQAAVRLLHESVRYFEQLDYPWAVASSTRALGEALLRAGELPAATAAFSRALTLHDQVGDRRGIAECLEGFAGVCGEWATPATAARLLGAARAQRARGAAPPSDVEQARLTRLDDRITAELGASRADHERQAGRTMPHSAMLDLAASVTLTQPGDTGTVTLTDRQWEVAELVAAGNTNRQIGRRLGISEKTTEVHVHNIMKRLRAPSRTGIATWLARNPHRAP
jgi:non-specific serine/threonine protein kinase